MGAGENSALNLAPPSLPAGVTAKMLLTTAPYDAQNPQMNQVIPNTPHERVARSRACTHAHLRRRMHMKYK